MGLFLDHLLQGSYPYLTPQELIDSCSAASGAAVDDDYVLDAVEDASLAIYYLTGRHIGGSKQVTVTPNDLARDACGPYRLNLGLWPVTDIIAVREEGADQDVTDYHIDEWTYIVKDNGEQFPRRANWYAAAGDTDDNEDSDGGYVFEITVEYGIPAPRLIKRATRALACALYCDATGAAAPSSCSLPDRVTSVTRQGVTMEIDNFTNLMNDGSTGIYEVDLAVRVFNPTRMQSPSFVWTPETSTSRRRYT